MVLDSIYTNFNLRKIGMAVPSLLAFCLICYISYIFFWFFIPDVWQVSNSQYLWLFGRRRRNTQCVRSCFGQFSSISVLWRAYSWFALSWRTQATCPIGSKRQWLQIVRHLKTFYESTTCVSGWPITSILLKSLCHLVMKLLKARRNLKSVSKKVLWVSRVWSSKRQTTTPN